MSKIDTVRLMRLLGVEKVHIAIDVAGDVLRLRGPDAYQELFGLVGVPPRISRESFVWDRPKAARSSLRTECVSLADVWSALSSAQSEPFKWEYDGGTYGYRTLTDLIGEALVQNDKSITKTKTVIAVDDHLEEGQQDLLLQSLSAAGAHDIDLLWRPIALALAFMESAPPNILQQGNKLLIIDAESIYPEVTCVELKEHDGQLLPLRSIPNQQTASCFPWGGQTIRRKIAHEFADGKAEVASQLLAGPFAEQFISFTEARPCSDVWYRDGIQHHVIDFTKRVALEKREHVIREMSMRAIRDAISQQYPIDSMAAVLWHGWPFRVLGNQGLPQSDVLLPPDAVVHGAYLYGGRLLTNQPTYLDTLPGLYILSEVSELETFAYFPLVVPGTLEGGKTWELPSPLRRFAVNQGVANFPTVLRRSDEIQCRRLITPIPAPVENTPVIIRAKMKPAHGRAKVTIEGAEGHEDVFGDRRAITLDWDTMTMIEDPLVSAPAYYPVRGRLFDDPEYPTVLNNFLNNGQAGMYSVVSYRGHDVVFWKLMEPWGYSPPWHAARGCPAGWVSEPQRGMFGSEYIPYDSNLLERLVDRINTTARLTDRLKYFNYMFVYAPDYYKEELRNIYRQIAPLFNSWNWALAPGRVFSTKVDFELFADFLIRSANGGAPAYPAADYTQHYLWSFFRCLCYHQDTVNISVEKIQSVLEMIHAHINGGTLPYTEAKYCLCLILFSTRIRTRLPDFLQPLDPLCEMLVRDVMEELPHIAYPPAMLAEVDDPHGEGLNGLVFRFLQQTASASDFRALEGLTTSMA